MTSVARSEACLIGAHIDNPAAHTDNPLEPDASAAHLPSSSATPQAADLQARLSQIERLLSSEPARADAQAAELLAAVPNHPMALLFQGIARRLMGQPAAAIEVLSRLCEQWPDAPLPHLQLGLALRETGDAQGAVRAIRRAATVKPDFSDAWLALADLLTTMGNREAADQAFGSYIEHSARDPRLLAPATALRENRVAEAESLLRGHLQRHPTDVAALCLLADAAARQGQMTRAEELLTRCLQLAPSYRAARHNYAVALMRQDKPIEALQELERLLKDEPGSSDLRKLRAAVLMRIGAYDQAIDIYDALLGENPAQPKLWATLGHALRMVGRRERCIEAYRKAIALDPQCGEAYWNLANLKNLETTDSELESMRVQLAKPALPAEDRVHLHFAVGKALEDRRVFDESFRQYAEGNRLRRRSAHYNASDLSAYVRRSKDLYTPAFFAERGGSGAQAADPLFIVGLPRSGSTLVEQILASHSAVEGTMELTHLTGIARSLAERPAESTKASYPEVVASLTQAQYRELGEAYIEGTRIQRRRDTPFFIDKMPNNFLHVGLIHLILPKARIVDVRRHPLACGLSLFKHLFAQGQHFSYSLEDIGRYYRDYVDLMAHFDAVLPGRVHRVVYESLVQDTETEVRRLLEHCGLPFEDSCLKFYENARAVSTPSSEQVRTPVFREALGHWRHYEPWLTALKEQLGSLVETYPYDQPS